ncbi:uncharacterized protein METZ01_LOCUS322894 [marine metagenome]|uniref:Uncharacterized protein n=1 Tax=marine metagenome TaxID=408172 RepID=A0A382PB44_9ZZZZ
MVFLAVLQPRFPRIRRANANQI